MELFRSPKILDVRLNLFAVAIDALCVFGLPPVPLPSKERNGGICQRTARSTHATEKTEAES